jgi:hypothetical protein
VANAERNKTVGSADSWFPTPNSQTDLQRDAWPAREDEQADDLTPERQDRDSLGHRHVLLPSMAVVQPIGMVGQNLHHPALRHMSMPVKAEDSGVSREGTQGRAICEG